MTKGALMLAAIPFPNVSPEIFTIEIGGAGFSLRWYALAYIVGILIGWFIAARALSRPDIWRARAPMRREQLDDLLTWIIIGIIAGGRLGYVLFYQPAHSLAAPTEILMIWKGGMSFHGGFLGVVVVLLIFSRRTGAELGGISDMLALSAPPGLFLGRIANFVNAELWGRPTELPWGVIFPGVAAQDCPGVIGPCARHPSQLYEAALEGLLLGLLLLVLAFRRGWLKSPWAISGAFFAGYGAARFAIEFLRQADAWFVSPDNPLGHAISAGELGLSMGQVLSLPMLVAGIAIVIIARRRTQ